MKIKNFIKKLSIGLSVLGCAVGITSFNSFAYTLPSDSFQGVNLEYNLEHSFTFTDSQLDNYIFIYEILGNTSYNNLNLGFSCDYGTADNESVVSCDVSIGFSNTDVYNSSSNALNNYFACLNVESSIFTYDFDYSSNNYRSLMLLGDFENPINYNYLYIIFSGYVYENSYNYVSSFVIEQLNINYCPVPYGDLSSQVNSLTDRVNQLTNENATLKTTNDDLFSSNTRLHAQIYALNNQINDLNIQINSLNSQVNSLQDTIDNLTYTDFTLKDLLLSIGFIPFSAFASIWNVNFLGFNIAQVVLGLITLLLVFAIIKKFIL